MSGNEETYWARLAGPLTHWYRKNRRDLPWRDHPTPYQTWISEIMLQQTRVEAVKGYYARFLAAAPDAAALAALDRDRLMKLWEGLGYYSRAANLQKCAQVLVERYGGQLPADYGALLALPGIGPYTAGAIASIAFGLPTPAVDGNVLRVYARCRNDRADIALPETRGRVTQVLTGALALLPEGAAGDFNQAVMELGATLCGPNAAPRCLLCPAAECCAGLAAGTVPELPVKGAKKSRRLEQYTVLLLTRDGSFALRKRGKRGLLAGLWELPNVPGYLDGAALPQTVRALGVEPLRIEPLGPARHVFTHVEWQMQGYRVTVETAREGELHWVSGGDLDGCALPSAFRYYLP